MAEKKTTVAPLEQKREIVEPGNPVIGVSRPEIFNTDQGAQFTSEEFTGRLKEAGVRISMDGRGRLYDNISVESLWRTVKYEEVYLYDYRTVQEARERLGIYFHFYNTERLHAALDYQRPHEMYFRKPKVEKPLLGERV